MIKPLSISLSNSVQIADELAKKSSAEQANYIMNRLKFYAEAKEISSEEQKKERNLLQSIYSNETTAEEKQQTLESLGLEKAWPKIEEAFAIMDIAEPLKIPDIDATISLLAMPEQIQAIRVYQNQAIQDAHALPKLGEEFQAKYAATTEKIKEYQESIQAFRSSITDKTITALGNKPFRYDSINPLALIVVLATAMRHGATEMHGAHLVPVEQIVFGHEIYAKYRNLSQAISDLEVTPMKIASHIEVTKDNGNQFGHLDLFSLKLLESITSASNDVISAKIKKETPAKIKWAKEIGRLPLEQARLENMLAAARSNPDKAIALKLRETLEHVQLHAKIIGYTELENQLKEKLGGIDVDSKDEVRALKRLAIKMQRLVSKHQGLPTIDEGNEEDDDEDEQRLSATPEITAAPTVGGAPAEEEEEVQDNEYDDDTFEDDDDSDSDDEDDSDGDDEDDEDEQRPSEIEKGEEEEEEEEEKQRVSATPEGGAPAEVLAEQSNVGEDVPEEQANKIEDFLKQLNTPDEEEPAETAQSGEDTGIKGQIKRVPVTEHPLEAVITSQESSYIMVKGPEDEKKPEESRLNAGERTTSTEPGLQSDGTDEQKIDRTENYGEIEMTDMRGNHFDVSAVSKTEGAAPAVEGAEAAPPAPAAGVEGAAPEEEVKKAIIQSFKDNNIPRDIPANLIAAVTNFIAAAAGENSAGISSFTFNLNIILASSNPSLIDIKGWGKYAGNTALMLAAEKDKKDIVELLLQHKVNPEATNKDGKTALMLTTNKDIQAALEKAIATKGAAAKEVGRGGGSGDHSHLELDQKRKLQEKAQQDKQQTQPTRKGPTSTAKGPTSTATRSAR